MHNTQQCQLRSAVTPPGQIVRLKQKKGLSFSPFFLRPIEPITR
ncbi:MAG: hypothetical protein HLUCCO03_05875 [Marinobacter sp. HL-58]|nr:MAG: hypothetical protein HLUCCO03_05875 [Marinobacter sp. HL-58]